MLNIHISWKERIWTTSYFSHALPRYFLDENVGAFLFTAPTPPFFQEIFPPYGRSTHKNHRKSHLDMVSCCFQQWWHRQAHRKKAVKIGLHLQVQRWSGILATQKSSWTQAKIFSYKMLIHWIHKSRGWRTLSCCICLYPFKYQRSAFQSYCVHRDTTLHLKVGCRFSVTFQRFRFSKQYLSEVQCITPACFSAHLLQSVEKQTSYSALQHTTFIQLAHLFYRE